MVFRVIFVYLCVGINVVFGDYNRDINIMFNCECVDCFVVMRVLRVFN